MNPMTSLTSMTSMTAVTRSNGKIQAPSCELVPTLCLVFSGQSIRLEPEILVLSPGVTPLGRNASPQQKSLLKGDENLSREHAHVHMTVSAQGGPPKVRIVDNGSKNGTLVNDVRVGQCDLQEGDVLRLGHSLFVYRLRLPDLPDAPSTLLLGSSPAIHSARHALSCAAMSMAPVLVLGESGSGKDLAAQIVHQHGRATDRRGTLVAVNCANLEASVADSQLFGHVKGAFSGADRPSDGFFRAADGGTLFLDEVGELDRDVQAKLLRAIESRTVTPVGATRELAVDVRLVCATNRDLQQEIERNNFRGDLYERIATLPVYLPPLRARREDILFLFAHKWKDAPLTMDPDLAQRLLSYDWPRNVRELGNCRDYISANAKPGTRIELALFEKWLALRQSSVPPPPSALRSGLRPAPHPVAASDPSHAARPARTRLPPPADGPPVPREELEQTLAACNGNIQQVGVEYEKSYRSVKRWIDKYEIEYKRYKKK